MFPYLLILPFVQSIPFVFTTNCDAYAKGRGSDLTYATQKSSIRTRAKLGAALLNANTFSYLFLHAKIYDLLGSLQIIWLCKACRKNILGDIQSFVYFCIRKGERLADAAAIGADWWDRRHITFLLYVIIYGMSNALCADYSGDSCTYRLFGKVSNKIGFRRLLILFYHFGDGSRREKELSINAATGDTCRFIDNVRS